MIAPGVEETAQQTVTPDMLAPKVGSGDVDVLATPALLALVERVAVASVASALQPGTTTVGVRVELDHLAPTPVGALVSASLRLDTVRGRTLGFSFQVRDPAGVIARGRHMRVVVVREEFLQGATARGPEPD
jgi:fluoroacetyl-CoA thioesterase